MILDRLKQCLDKILDQAEWESRNKTNFLISDYWEKMQNQIELWFFALRKVREKNECGIAIEILEKLERDVNYPSLTEGAFPEIPPPRYLMFSFLSLDTLRTGMQFFRQLEKPCTKTRSGSERQ